MYDADLDEPAKAMTSDLNEELGQVGVQTCSHYILRRLSKSSVILNGTNGKQFSSFCL